MLAGQQFEEGLEGDQRRYAGNAPTGGGLEHLVDLAQLRDAVKGHAELLDAVEVFLARATFDHFQLAGDQGVPHLVLGFRIVDETVGIGFTGHVLRRFHSASLEMGLRCCVALSIAQDGPGCSRGGACAGLLGVVKA
ncbi:hypothetical protein D9M69_473400 [compost metagenome]